MNNLNIKDIKKYVEIAFVVFVISSISSFFEKKKPDNKVQESTVVSTNNKSDNQENTETVKESNYTVKYGFNTYTNEQGNFSYDIPKSWTYETSDNYEYYYVPDSSNGSFVMVTGTELESKINIEDDNEIDIFLKAYEEGAKGLAISNSERIVIDGYPARIGEGIFTLGSDEYEIHLFQIIKEDGSYSISFINMDEGVNYDNVIDQIFSQKWLR